MAVRSSVEVERTFELPAGTGLPDLVGVAGIAEVRQLADEELDATYYDTSDLRLASARITLRRREGGRDAGWHLKLPVAGKGREEVVLPLGRATTVPVELHALVRSRAQEAPLRAVARIRSRRRVHVLLEGDGRVLAEVAEDQVVGEVLGTRDVTEWRELEVELVTADEAFLDAVGEVFAAQGGWVSEQQSKLGRTLGERVPVRVLGAASRRRPAAEAVRAHLAEQVEELLARDPSARRDVPDGVHRMRVATRRLRSALKTYRPLLDRTATDPLRDELKHLAGVLGTVRDAEVLRDRLLEEVQALPSAEVIGPAQERIRTDLDLQHAEAHASLLVELNGPRYLALLEALAALVAAPPWLDRSERKAGRELPRLVRRAVRVLDRAIAAATEGPTEQDRDLLLHEVRKSAKQARYAAESTVPVLGKPAAAFATAATRLQEVLGEHQDSVVARARIRQLSESAHAGGESAYTFGVLQGVELRRGEAARGEYAKARRRAQAKRVRRWLSR
jgi:CHAD domain-containing protein